MVARVKPGTIVVAWDFSKGSTMAVQTAMTMMADASLIRVVHVAPLSETDSAIGSEGSKSQRRREIERRFRDQVADIPGAHELPFYVVHGVIAKEIATFADRYQAAMIVMTTRDHWDLSRLVFGSHSAQVLHLAECPVLVLKGLELPFNPPFESLLSRSSAALQPRP